LLFTTLILSHIIACLWYFLAKIEGFGPDTWVVRRGIMDESNFMKYLNAMYWTYATISTVGYGDIAAET
jgi:hypothetical protein